MSLIKQRLVDKVDALIDQAFAEGRISIKVYPDSTMVVRLHGQYACEEEIR
jgi:hypothetical protein